ncbi:MAG: FmdB family zinc ribbon protein [Terriglobia bacterium]
MPIFEYQCRDCGAKFEQIVQTQRAEVACRHCESPRVERLLSVFAVSGDSRQAAAMESGPCPCGAPRRGMCGE